MQKSQLRDARALSRESALTHVQLGTTGNRTSACRLFQISFAQVELGQTWAKEIWKSRQAEVRLPVVPSWTCVRAL